MLAILVNNEVVNLKTQMPWRKAIVTCGSETHTMYFVNKSRLALSKDAIKAGYVKAGYKAEHIERSLDYILDQPTLQLLHKDGAWYIGQNNPLPAVLGPTDFQARAELIRDWLLKGHGRTMFQGLSAPGATLTTANSETGMDWTSIWPGGPANMYRVTTWYWLIKELREAGYATLPLYGETVPTSLRNMEGYGNNNAYSQYTLANIDSPYLHMLHFAHGGDQWNGKQLVKFADSVPWSAFFSLGPGPEHAQASYDRVGPAWDPCATEEIGGKRVFSNQYYAIQADYRIRLFYPKSVQGDHVAQVYRWGNVTIEETFCDSTAPLPADKPVWGSIECPFRIYSNLNPAYRSKYGAPASGAYTVADIEKLSSWHEPDASLLQSVAVPSELDGIIAAFGKAGATTLLNSQARGDYSHLLDDWTAAIRPPVCDRWNIRVTSATFVEPNDVTVAAKSLTYAINTSGSGFQNLLTSFRLKYTGPVGSVLATKRSGLVKTSAEDLTAMSHPKFAKTVFTSLGLQSPYETMKINGVALPDLLEKAKTGFKHMMCDATSLASGVPYPERLTTYRNHTLTAGYATAEGAWDADGALIRLALVKGEEEIEITKEEALLLVTQFGKRWQIYAGHALTNDAVANFLDSGVSAASLLSSASSKYTLRARTEFRVDRLLNGSLDLDPTRLIGDAGIRALCSLAAYEEQARFLIKLIEMCMPEASVLGDDEGAATVAPSADLAEHAAVKLIVQTGYKSDDLQAMGVSQYDANPVIQA